MQTTDSSETPTNDERGFIIDKLTKIDGIARKTSEVMYDIGIHSYADLAAYLRQHTAEEISEALREHGLNRPPGFIKVDAWRRQAELFAVAEKDFSVVPEKEPATAADTVEAPSGIESREHDAVFTVLFDVVKNDTGEALLQTTVYDEKNGGKEVVFREGEITQWVNWMLKQAHLPLDVTQIVSRSKVAEEMPPTETKAALPTNTSVSQVAEETPRAETKVAPPGVPSGSINAQIEISNIRLSAIAQSADTTEKMLKAEVIFNLSGNDAEALTYQHQPYRIEIYTIEYGQGTPAFVAANEDRLQPHVYEYKQQLEFTMPAVGRYELHSLVRLPASGELKGYHQGPTLRITP